MNKINTFQEMVDYITIVCENKLTSNIYIPGGLLLTKVQESYFEALNEAERERLLELYKLIPKIELDEMIVPGNSFRNLDALMDLDELNDFQDLNTLLYSMIQLKLYVYYKALTHNEKKGFVFYYDKIFSKVEKLKTKEIKLKSFLVAISIIGGVLLYLAKDNLDAYYAIAVAIGICLVSAAIYLVSKSLKSDS